MIDNFNNIFYLTLFIVYLCLIGFYVYRCLFDPIGLTKEFNTGKESVYLIRVIGTFVLSLFLMGIYILLRPSGLSGTWIYFNLAFLLGLFQASYDAAFYFKLIDTETGAKNSLVDVIVGAFFLLTSIILILGLSDKIYAFSAL